MKRTIDTLKPICSHPIITYSELSELMKHSTAGEATSPLRWVIFVNGEMSHQLLTLLQLSIYASDREVIL